MDISQLLSLSQELYPLRLINGLDSTLESEFSNTNHMRINSFYLTVLSTPIRLLFLLQVSITQIDILMDFQK